MSISPYSSADWRSLLGLTLALILFGLNFVDSASADDETPEHITLAAIIRQLDTIERLAAQEATRPNKGQRRYYFDYARLHEDIDRIRSGIEDHLTPQRAQPRDPVELSGDYRRESEEAP